MGDDGGDGGFVDSSGGYGGHSGDGGYGGSNSGSGAFGGDGGYIGSGGYGGDGGYTGSSGYGGDSEFRGSRGADYTNLSSSYSIEPKEDNQPDWNQGHFNTSIDEPEKTNDSVDEGIYNEGDDDRDNKGLSLYPALAVASFMKDPSPNENGDAPMSLLLTDTDNNEQQTEGVNDGCGPVDYLYYSLVCCCTIL